MITVLLTPTEAEACTAGDPIALVTLRETIRKLRAFDALLPWPDPPRLTICRNGEFCVEYYNNELCDQLESAIECVLRRKVWFPPPVPAGKVIYQERLIEWP